MAAPIVGAEAHPRRAEVQVTPGTPARTARADPGKGVGVDRDEKQHVVAELTERLRATEALIVADYRGLTMPQIDSLRGRLLEQGARFTVVKNTLSRRAAKDAGVEALLAMLEGPTAIAFVQSEGSMVEVARALADSARETR